MKGGELTKHTLIGVLLFLGVCWSLAAASTEGLEGGYPNADLLASVDWLNRHIGEEGVVVVDVRTDTYFDGELLPGAGLRNFPMSTARMPNVFFYTCCRRPPGPPYP